MSELLAMLEKLLALTEPFVDAMTDVEREDWQFISARVADIRDGDAV
jgi:hypothetical protein